MNPVEWLVYVAAWRAWCGPWGALTNGEVFALAQTLAEGSRRG